MIREYIFCSALYSLGIKTSRALAVVLTNQKVIREYDAKPGALLVRVMESHVRVGTFEYASAYLDTGQLRRLADYVIKRHYKQIPLTSEHRYIHFFEAVMERQIDMVVDWLRVGFVHGVMNTDNMSITGETFDYGPCAFMNYYDPGAVFSSIDKGGRYSFGNQKDILHWNLARFAQALLPLIDDNGQKAVESMNAVLARFENMFDARFYAMMRQKLGIDPGESSHDGIIDALLTWLKKSGADYTNTFLALSDRLMVDDALFTDPAFLDIKNRLASAGGDPVLMARNNPCFIPRNYLVEEAIEEYEKSASLDKVRRLLQVMQNPYVCDSEYASYQQPPSAEFESNYATFCNT